MFIYFLNYYEPLELDYCLVFQIMAGAEIVGLEKVWFQSMRHNRRVFVINAITLFLFLCKLRIT